MNGLKNLIIILESIKLFLPSPEFLISDACIPTHNHNNNNITYEKRACCWERERERERERDETEGLWKEHVWTCWQNDHSWIREIKLIFTFRGALKYHVKLYSGAIDDYMKRGHVTPTVTYRCMFVDNTVGKVIELLTLFCSRICHVTLPTVLFTNIQHYVKYLTYYVWSKQSEQPNLHHFSLLRVYQNIWRYYKLYHYSDWSIWSWIQLTYLSLEFKL